MTVKFTAVWTIGTSMLGVAVVYYVYRNIKQRRKKEKLNYITYTMTIPVDIFGEIVGHKGRNLNLIKKQTKTTISFKSEEDCLFDKRTTYITGISENVKQAEKLVQDLIKDVSRFITEEIIIPTSVCSWLEGYERDTINMIRWFSGSKITICRSDDVNRPSAVTVRGTTENNSLAKTIICEKLEDAKYFFRISMKQDIQPIERPPHWRLFANDKDGFVPTIVSAALTPGHFWVQPAALIIEEFDIMEAQMLEFYDNPKNREEYKFTDELKVGDIVAMSAAIDEDELWYRAEVVDLRDPIEGLETEKCIRLFNIDYGLVEVKRLSDVFILKDKWMVLPRRAVECCLANVKPIEGEWSDDATDIFENLTSACALADLRTTVIMARPVSYGLPPPESNSRRLVPFVDLVDANVYPQISIAGKLVALGEALWDLPPSSL